MGSTPDNAEQGLLRLIKDLQLYHVISVSDKWQVPQAILFNMDKSFYFTTVISTEAQLFQMNTRGCPNWMAIRPGFSNKYPTKLTNFARNILVRRSCLSCFIFIFWRLYISPIGHGNVLFTVALKSNISAQNRVGHGVRWTLTIFLLLAMRWIFRLAVD